MKRLMIAMMCLGVAGYVSAQEAESAPAEETAPAGEAVAPSDAGSEAAAQAMEESAPCSKKFRSAKKVLKDCVAEKGWEERWDEEKGRLFVIESATVDTKDPANDKDFFAKREMAAKAAVLQAKVAVIQMINTEMSGSDMIDMPGSDVNKTLGAEREKIAQAVQEQMKELVTLVAKTSQAEADMLAGTKFSQRLDDMMAAMIKKINSAYNDEKHNEAAKARYLELRKRLEQSIKTYKALKEQADKLQMEVKERQESSVTLMAKMPIFGVTVIMQTESFNKETGKYEVAVCVTWSKALEAAARAVALGQPLKCKPGKMSVNAWLKKQNLATMTGPRQYVDDKGNRWFLGVTARVYDESMPSYKLRKAKGIVDAFARQMAVFCVFADVEAVETAAQAKETRANDETNETSEQVAEDYATKMSQKFTKKTVRGLQRLASDEVEHPITGDNIYVSVYGINASSAAEALAAETRQYATAVESERHQTVEKGRKAANESAVRAATNRADDFQKGAQKQTRAIGRELQSRKPAAKGGIAIKQEASAPATKKAKTTTGGTFGGDADIDDNF